MRRTAVILGVGAGLLIVAFVLWQNRSLFGDQFDIGDVRANEWVVEGFDQDGQTLVVSTFFGGVASDCTRFQGWEVDEREDAVEIEALIWERRFQSVCTDDGAVEQLTVNLEAPLGDRALVGCGQDECLQAPDAESFGGVADAGEAVATENFVVIQRSGESPVVFNNAGDRVDELESTQLNLRRGQVVFGDVVVFDYDGEVVAVDLSSDEILWRARGFRSAIDDESIYLCRGADSNSIVSIDARTGEEQWTADVPCTGLVPQGEQLTVVTFDPNVDGGHLLAQIDAETGEVLSLEPLDDGTDDQVTGLDDAVGVDGLTVTGGAQANLIIFDAEGSEVFRDDNGIGTPIGATDGVVFFGRPNNLIAFDLQERQELWRSQNGSVVVGDESIWQLTPGAVSRLDPADGNTLWTADIGVTSSFDVGEQEGVAFVVTSLEIFAIDNTSGEALWSQPIDG